MAAGSGVWNYFHEHCWNGDHTRPDALSRLRYNLMYVEKMLARIQQTAPKGADLQSWRY